MSESRFATIFVSSSSGSLGYAEAVQRNLRDVHHRVTVWQQGAIRPAKFILAELCELSQKHEFGVFFFAPDDITRIRSREQSTVRDNVLFELGLFMGKQGIERAFIIVPRMDNFRIPSDLSGFGYETYDPEDPDQVRAVGPACAAIKQCIHEYARKASTRDEPSSDPAGFEQDLESVVKGHCPDWGVLAKIIFGLVREAPTSRSSTASDPVPLRIEDVIQLSALPSAAEEVLSYCRALSSRGFLIRGPHPDSRWSTQTSIVLLSGDANDPRCIEYWRKLVDRRSQRPA